jgi:ABC-type multidrug transport system ATPase subunit
MQPPPVIDLKGVSKRYGRAVALNGVDLSLHEREGTLLLGSNGAGKSTLLNVLSTLTRPSQGEYWFKGTRLYNKGVTGHAVRRELGMISHDSRFYMDLTARENLRVFASLYGMKNIARRIPEALEQVRLETVPDIPVGTFSSGMLKRLALARLLLAMPRVLLLDEPYSGLDHASILLMNNYLAQVAKQGCTWLLVTHQFSQAVSLCSRVLVLQQGCLVYNRSAVHLDELTCANIAQEYSVPRSSPEHSQ